MKKLFLLLFWLPTIAIAQVTPKPAPKGFVLEGKLDGFPDGTEVTLYKNGENVEMAKAKLMKTKFVLKGDMAEPTLCFLVIGMEKPVEIYIENAAISIKGKKMSPPVFEIEGSASHRDFASFIKEFLPLAQHVSAIAGKLNATAPGDERDKLMTSYNSSQTELQSSIDKFITARPKSPVAAFILNVTYSFNEDVVMLEKRYNTLDAKVKNSATGMQLKEFIEESKIGAVGTQALDFSQPDTTGNQVSLSSFRGKYVLVDFWASWCGPCRSENPNVVDNYKKFSGKNFTVLGVSLDRPGQKDKWLNAIHEDQLTWTHVSDLQFWNNSAAVMYRIKGIPQNILVDPQGKIVGKNLRGPALEAKLCELLGCN